MADSVRITIEADDKTAAGIASAVANLGKLEKATEKVSGKGGAGGSGVKGLGGALGGLNQALGAVGLPAIGVTAAIGGIVAVTKNAIQTSAKYNEQVRDLSFVTGTGAEKTSRLLQVLDDYQLTAEDVTVATKAMTKQGYEPTVDTIAKLSDQYNSLNSTQEKNAFILKNFGKGGLQWVNLLSQGSDNIMALNDDVSKNLVLTDEQIAAYEKYRLNMDAVGDSIQGAKVQAGNFIFDQANQISAGIDKAQAIRKALDSDPMRTTYSQLGRGSQGDERIKTFELMYEQAQITGQAFEDMKAPLDSATLSYIQMAKAAQTADEEGAFTSAEDYKAMTKDGLALTKMNNSYADSVKAINKQFDDGAYVQELYKNQVAELKDQRKDGDITDREYYDTLTKLNQAYKDGSFAIDQQSQAMDALDASMDASTLDLALSQLQQMEDLDPAKVYDFAVATGKITETAAQQAKGQDTLRSAYANGQISADAYAQALEAISGNMESLNGMSVEAFVDIYIKTHGGGGVMPSDLVALDASNSSGAGVYGSLLNQYGHAAGKIGVEPGLHPVGEKGEEGLRMNPDGTVDVIPADVWAQAKKWGFGGEGFAGGVLGLGGGTGGGGGIRKGAGGSSAGIRRGARLTADIRGSSIAGSFAALNGGGGELGAAGTMVASSNNAVQASMNANVAATQQTNNALTEIRNILANQSSRADEAAQGAYQRNVGING